MDHGKTGSVFNKGSIFGCSTADMMKRSPSEMALRELFATENDDKVRSDGGAEVVAGDGGGGGDGDHIPSFPTYSSEFQAGFSYPTSLGQFSSPSPYPIQSNVSATIDSQSSVCADSPSSAYNPKSGGNRALGASSGSSHERLDEDDELEIEAGPCEQSTNPPDVRRIRRMVSNRQSAQRSRRRKQAHLTDLEQQVEQLRGESSSLFKQLADATQQFKDATTNNRVLRSDVEALRAKVKLAEDMVARGSLTTSLNHLLQNYLNTAQDCMNNATIPAANIPPPMVPVCGNDNSPYTRILTEPAAGLDNPETFSQNIPNGAIPSTVHNSQMPDTWPWESHIAPVSK